MKKSKTRPDRPTKLVSFVGRSNSGKTTLLTNVIPALKRLGLTVGTIKNTHHDVEFDTPGKDSWKYSEVGSDRVLVSSGTKLAVFSNFPTESSLHDLVNDWFQDFDLVISEGFKNEDCFKIEVFRSSLNKIPLFENPLYKVDAVVSDIRPDLDIPCFDFDDIDPLIKWIMQTLDLKPKVTP